MKHLALPLAVAGMMAAVPALAQNRQGMEQSALVPVQDVVMAVEQRLSQLGYAVQPDGQFDADTRNSVLLFQSDSGLQPTGNIDLSTIAALGINVDPAGAGTTTAMVEPMPQTAAVIAEVKPETGAALLDGDYPMLRTEHMSAPQIAQEADSGRFENVIGVPQPAEVAAAPDRDIPGIDAYYIEQHWE